jgi:hypothetical protein
VVWQNERGEIPAGMVVRHSCLNLACINPTHLFLGRSGDNSRERAGKLRLAAEAKTDEILEMSWAGRGIDKIGKALGVSPIAIKRILKAQSRRG